MTCFKQGKLSKTNVWEGMKDKHRNMHAHVTRSRRMVPFLHCHIKRETYPIPQCTAVKATKAERPPEEF